MNKDNFVITPLHLNEYSKIISCWREQKGFVTSWDNMLEKLMLVVSEVSEAAEAYRNNDHEEFNEEVADIFIRLLDVVGTLNINIEFEIRKKMDKNFNRQYQHGKSRGM